MDFNKKISKTIEIKNVCIDTGNTGKMLIEY